MRKTKIICTLGPATDDEEILKQLMISGMDVCRINMSHATHEDARKRANSVKKAREELNLPVALLLDTKGPEIRTEKFEGGKALIYRGNEFTLFTDGRIGNTNGCSITYKDLPKYVKKDDTILIDDGLIGLTVISTDSDSIRCKIIDGGTVKDHKGINVPSVKIPMEYISEQDKSDIKFAVDEDFDFIAASFVRCEDDVLKLRKELENDGGEKIRIISKIENSEGVANIDDIIRASDGIMVARGDMGVEINFEEVPIIQKELIKKGYRAGKQVVTATQMLDSMMQHPRPTRAEVTDVANAIYDGTSAIMLSGETAAGKYPVESVKTMARIAIRTEKDINYIARFENRDIREERDVTSAISHATCTTAHDLGAVAILTVSQTGQTARMISKYRPACPIICGSSDKKVIRQMNLSWGVSPIPVDMKTNTDDLFEHLVNVAEKYGYVKSGDLAVITAGIPLGVSGTTNMLKVHLIGDILIEGKPINKGIVSARVCVCNSIKDLHDNFRDGDIIVIKETDNQMLQYIKKASAIITESSGENSHAAVVGLALDKPVIVGAKNATKLLSTGIMVRVDGTKGIVLNISGK
jgi:pyruvate kinase